MAWEASEFSKEEFAHYTLKEIKEQPKIIHSTLSQNKLILEKSDQSKIMDSAKPLHEAEDF